MSHVFMTKEMVIGEVRSKVEGVRNRGIESLTSKEKAYITIELEKLYSKIDSFRYTDEIAGKVADECMQLKHDLAMSEYKTVESMKSKRAKVIAQGVSNTGYDIPFMN